MKKEYKELEIEISKFTVEPVMTLSGDGDNGSGDEYEIEF